MRILIACGGTGGHIFPGLSLYNALKQSRPDADILLALDKRAVSSLIVPKDYPRVYLALSPIKCDFNLQGIIVVLKLIKGVFQSLVITLKFWPDVVVGFGGYASFFIVFFAWVLRRKTVIHESNVKPGLANAILAYFVDKIAIGFVQTKEYLGVNAFKAECIGTPLRPDLARIDKSKAREFLNLQTDVFTILIMGGSQGAEAINTLLFNAVKLIEDKSKIQVIHLYGSRQHSFLENAYKDLGIKAKVADFFDQMGYAYSAADIVISRAGTASINEIACFRLPSVLIPYPYGSRHQIENAKLLDEQKAAILVKQTEASAPVLRDKISGLYNSCTLQDSISKNISNFFQPKAGVLLADLVLNRLGKKG